MLDSDSYDVIILGTGLAESIAAASLAKAGHSVLHLDPNDYYGGEQASLTLDELIAWAGVRAGTEPSGAASTDPSSSTSSSSDYLDAQRARYAASTTSGLGSLAADRRRYALTLFPALMPSRGDLVGTLISSDVSKYVGFRLLDGVAVREADGEFHRVPGAKEDVFKDKSISLLDKRRLMRALMFAGGDFEADPLMQGHENDPIYDFVTATFQLSPRLATALTYAVAHAASPTEPTLPALQRARKYLRSIGRYGPSAFLVGQYGGAGEVAQGFCRACAVFGGTYVLGPDATLSSLSVSDAAVTLKIAGHPRELTAKHLIASPDFLPASLSPAVTSVMRTAHAVAVLTSRPAFLSRPKAASESEASEGEPAAEVQEEADDTAVLVLPPAPDSPLVRALVMGPGTGSCPEGQYIVYFWTEAGGIEQLRGRVAELADVKFEAYYERESRGIDAPSNEVSPESPTCGADTEGEKEGGGEEQKDTETKETEKKGAAPGAPLVVLNPYSGAHLLTEGLDWEAREGARAFAAVSDRVFFEPVEGADDEEEM